jgi:hypothetical protein
VSRRLGCAAAGTPFPPVSRWRRLARAHAQPSKGFSSYKLFSFILQILLDKLYFTITPY